MVSLIYFLTCFDTLNKEMGSRPNKKIKIRDNYRFFILTILLLLLLQVSFSINITVNGCPKQGKPQILKIRPLGFTEEVEIKLSFICDCECQKKGVVSSELCHNGNGTFECGACR